MTVNHRVGGSSPSPGALHAVAGQGVANGTVDFTVPFLFPLPKCSKGLEDHPAPVRDQADKRAANARTRFRHIGRAPRASRSLFGHLVPGPACRVGVQACRFVQSRFAATARTTAAHEPALTSNAFTRKAESNLGRPRGASAPERPPSIVW